MEKGIDHIMTIDLFNKLTGQETLHPLVTLADLSDNKLQENVCMPCNFYALIYKQGDASTAFQSVLWLLKPGEVFEIPACRHLKTDGYVGILFHPDLLFDTELEHSIDIYPTRCRCRSSLSKKEQQVIAGCLHDIGKELHHAIDCHSSIIIVSYIQLLLNYCTRFCSPKKDFVEQFNEEQ